MAKANADEEYNQNRMEFIILPLVALIASGLTLFSGFGLGTFLLPVFAAFFPVELAVAMTAVVHLLNNFFKLFLLGKYANKTVILQFGIPAMAAALAGSALLLWIAEMPPLHSYGPMNKYEITPVKLVVAALMIFFAALELTPGWKDQSFDRKYLPLGGALSGFFGGLSGHQGALRSAFLIRAGLKKEAFIASGVVIACLIDMTRLSIYAGHFSLSGAAANGRLILVTTLFAFAGAYLASRLLRKVTIRSIRILISLLLFLLAGLLAAGILS